MKYRKRPVVIEAVQFLNGRGREIADWCGGLYDVHRTPYIRS